MHDSDLLAGSDRAPGLADSPYLEREDMPDTTLANIERWAAGIPVPADAIDGQTAVKVVDSPVEVIRNQRRLLIPRGRDSGAGASLPT